MTKDLSESKPETAQAPISTVSDASEAKQTILDSFIRAIGIPTIVGSTLTAGAYLTGLAYHQAYLAQFKVIEGLFPKSSSEYFLYAFQAAIELLPAGLVVAGTDLRIPAILFGTVLFVMLIAKASKALEKSERLKHLQLKARQNKKFQLFGEFLALPAITVAATFYVVLALTFILILPAILGGISGKHAAENEMKRFAKGCKSIKGSIAFCTRILDGETTVAQGFIIQSSDRYVALIEDGKSRVIPIKEREFLPFEEN